MFLMVLTAMAVTAPRARALTASSTFILSWQGYDWDGAGEETLTLNGQFLTALPAADTPTNGGAWASFSEDITTFIENGTNTLTFTHALWDCGVSDDVSNLQVAAGSTVVYSSTTESPLSCTQSLTYTFDLSLNNTPSSPWPMFHQNPQHTGQSPFQGPATPFLKWTFQTGGAIDSPPAVDHGRIYVTSQDGNVYALNQDGELLWTVQTGGPLRSSPAIGSDGTIYVGGCAPCGPNPTPQGILYAISPFGVVKWNVTVQNSGEGVDSLTSPTIGPDGTIYVSDVGFRIVAVTPDGSLKWQVWTQGEVVDSPAVGADGTIYAQIDDPPQLPPCGTVLNKCLVALNPDGTIKWTLRDMGEFDSPAVGSDGTVYIDGLAVGPDGAVKWESPGTFSSPSIGSDGTIYGSAGNGVYAVNPDGTVHWRFPSNSTGVSIDSDGTIYFGNAGNVYAVNSDGSLKWSFNVGFTGCPPDLVTYVAACDPVIGSDQTLYIGSADGSLYAID
jgi:outer membrane protein assembly factor BamB